MVSHQNDWNGVKEEDGGHEETPRACSISSGDFDEFVDVDDVKEELELKEGSEEKPQIELNCDGVVVSERCVERSESPDERSLVHQKEQKESKNASPVRSTNSPSAMDLRNANLTRRAQKQAHLINAILQELPLENQEYFLKEMDRHVWRQKMVTNPSALSPKKDVGDVVSKPTKKDVNSQPAEKLVEKSASMHPNVDVLSKTPTPSNTNMEKYHMPTMKQMTQEKQTEDQPQNTNQLVGAMEQKDSQRKSWLDQNFSDKYSVGIPQSQQSLTQVLERESKSTEACSPVNSTRDLSKTVALYTQQTVEHDVKSNNILAENKPLADAVKALANQAKTQSSSRGFSVTNDSWKTPGYHLKSSPLPVTWNSDSSYRQTEKIAHPKHLSKNEPPYSTKTASQISEKVSEPIKVNRFNSKTKKSINILVLGQTGVGKSTCINSFVNYLTYGSLEEAVDAPYCLIPTKFTLLDENYESRGVVLGSHDNEVFSDEGQSVTQEAKVYRFEKTDFDVYIIDTPGMDDTRGIEQDNENVQKILKAIALFDEIHAICFLFKPNNARLTTSFRYSIGTLLENLSPSALENACFVFTNALGSFYRPGDTLTALRAYFQELGTKGKISVRITDENTFCVDNESFRYICARANGIEFTTEERLSFTKSWTHSSAEFYRLLNYVAQIKPHRTLDTLSINETRTWITQLIDPLLNISLVIQENIRQLDIQKKQLEKSLSIEELRQLATIRITTLENIKLENPYIVCSSPKCVGYETINGTVTPVYRQVCHKEYPSVHAENEAELALYAAFKTENLCKKCGCGAEAHQRIVYQQKLEVVPVDNSQKFLENEKNAGKLKKRLVEKVDALRDAYNKELDYTLFGMAGFSLFLTRNAITTSAKANIFKKRLEKLLDIELAKMSLADRTRSILYADRTRYDQLIQLLNVYLMMYDKQQKMIQHTSIEELRKIRQKLFTMSHFGSKIGEVFAINVDVDHQNFAAEVVPCNRSIKQWVVDGGKKVLKAWWNYLF